MSLGTPSMPTRFCLAMPKVPIPSRVQSRRTYSRLSTSAELRMASPSSATQPSAAKYPASQPSRYEVSSSSDGRSSLKYAGRP
jgi:hypothetical protein